MARIEKNGKTWAAFYETAAGEKCIRSDIPDEEFATAIADAARHGYEQGKVDALEAVSRGIEYIRCFGAGNKLGV